MVDIMTWMTLMTDILVYDGPQCDSHLESHWVTEYAHNVYVFVHYWPSHNLISILYSQILTYVEEWSGPYVCYCNLLPTLGGLWGLRYSPLGDGELVPSTYKDIIWPN